MSYLTSDLRQGFRNLVRRPAFTAVAVAALALGIGAQATIFSLVNALVLRPPMADEPSRIVSVHAVSRDGSGFHAFSYGDYRDYRDDNGAFSELAAWTMKLLSLSTGDEARVAAGQMVAESYFAVFGVEPAAGRFFSAEAGEGPLIGGDCTETLLLRGDSGANGGPILESSIGAVRADFEKVIRR